MKVSCSGINASFSKGKEYEVPEEKADEFIRIGYADEIPRAKPVANKVQPQHMAVVKRVRKKK